MSDPRLLARYGLKYNPFLPAIPSDDLWCPPYAEPFLFGVETLVMDGGFALLSGEPGLGKSKLLQLLAGRLEQVDDNVVTGVMERPNSGMMDFYRELGTLFGVDLSPANRYGGFVALRARWRAHIKSTLFRPVLLIDEAQEVPAACLNELRLLGSAHFDSQCLLTTVLCGDSRLPERFRSRDLLALGSRIRTRLSLVPLSSDELSVFLDHLLERAGAPTLMTDELHKALTEHAAGNPRVLATMGAQLLAAAARREMAVLDERLFLDTFSTRPPARRPRSSKKKKA